MKIHCVADEGRYGVLNLYVDEELWREIHTAIFGRKPKLPMNCQSLNELKEQFAILEYRAATVYVLKRLSMKPYLTAELEKRMEERLVSSETIQRVITECQRLGYLNDQEWLDSFVRRHLARNLGPMAILMKLRAKGISQTIAQQLLDKFDHGEGRKERIHHLLATRYRSRDLSDFHTREKVIASLIRKGFSFSDIKDAIREAPVKRAEVS